MKIQVMVLWIVMLFSDVTGYQCFREHSCHHLQGEVSGRQAVMLLLTVSQSVSQSWL
jgi:hypothetical protein